MTNEKAIQLLHRLSDEQFDGIHGDERREALSMAVRALSSQQTDTDSQGLVNDCISRKQAIDAIEEMQMPIMRSEWLSDQYKFSALAEVREKILQLPSAQPETAKRIVGKSRDGMTLWYQCDMCNEPVDAQDDFCRGCGRRLTDG